MSYLNISDSDWVYVDILLVIYCFQGPRFHHFITMAARFDLLCESRIQPILSIKVRMVQISETWEFDFHLNMEVTYITGRIRMRKNAAKLRIST